MEYFCDVTFKYFETAETFRYLALGLSESDGSMREDSVTFYLDSRQQIYILIIIILTFT